MAELDRVEELLEKHPEFRDLVEEYREARRLIQWFVDRCDLGQIRSFKTREVFKAFLQSTE